MVQIFVLFGECENKNHEHFNKRTLELEDGPPSIFRDLCGSLPCASSAARQSFGTPCVSTKSKRRRSFSWFSVEATVKASKPTGITGSLFLAKKCLARGKLAMGSIFHWCEDLAEKRDPQRHGLLLRPAYAKIKTAKTPSKVNTAFSRNIAPAKISRHTATATGQWQSTADSYRSDSQFSYVGLMISLG